MPFIVGEIRSFSRDIGCVGTKIFWSISHSVGFDLFVWGIKS